MAFQLKKTLLAWLGALILLGLGPQLLAAPGEASVTRQTHTVEYSQTDGMDWTRLSTALILAANDRLRTDPSGRAEAVFGTTLAILGPNTEVQVLALKAEASQVRLRRGSTRTRKPQGKTFQLVTPNATLTARGTEWVTEYRAPAAPGDPAPPADLPAGKAGSLGALEGETRLVVLDSAVDVETPIDKETVEAGHTALVDPEGNILVDPENRFFPTSVSEKSVEIDLGEGRRISVGRHVEETEESPIERGTYGEATDDRWGDEGVGAGDKAGNPRGNSSYGVDHGSH